jgi:hypothetical protein
MKYIIVLLFILCSCKDFEPKEVILSDRNKEWKVEVIEGHEFLWRDIDKIEVYIHRPNCKTCKLNNNVFE